MSPETEQAIVRLLLEIVICLRRELIEVGKVVDADILKELLATVRDARRADEGRVF